MSLHRLWKWFKTDPAQEVTDPPRSVDAGDILTHTCILYAPSSQPARQIYVDVCKDGSATIRHQFASHDRCSDEFLLHTDMGLTNDQRERMIIALGGVLPEKRE